MEYFIVGVIAFGLGLLIGGNYGERKWKQHVANITDMLDDAWDGWAAEAEKARQLAKELKAKVTN